MTGGIVSVIITEDGKNELGTTGLEVVSLAKVERIDI